MATCQMRSSPQSVCEPTVAHRDGPAGHLPSSEVKLVVKREIDKMCCISASSRGPKRTCRRCRTTAAWLLQDMHLSTKILECGRGQQEQQQFLHMSAAAKWRSFEQEYVHLSSSPSVEYTCFCEFHPPGWCLSGHGRWIPPVT